MFCPDRNRGSAIPNPTTRMRSRRGRTPKWTKVIRTSRTRALPEAARRAVVAMPMLATGDRRPRLEEVGQDRLLGDLGALQLRSHAAPVHHVGPVGEVEDLRQV